VKNGSVFVLRHSNFVKSASDKAFERIPFIKAIVSLTIRPSDRPGLGNRGPGKAKEDL
jgi:hypothetical protein